MARRSLRTSTGSTPLKIPSTPAAGSSAVKRSASNRGSAGAKKATRTTPTKSKYFKKEDELSDATPSETSEEEEASGYEDGGVDESEDDLEDEDDEYASDSPEPAAKRRRVNSKGGSKSATPAKTPGKKGNELWRPGVKAGLGPGKEAIIAKPKARGPGKTPYADDQIHPNTMLFLSELADNNDREWLKMHDPDYRQSWQDFTSFLEALQERIITIDETIPELPLKDIVFRIYRDVRFSPDPTPYKPYFSACWSRTGRKGPFAVYYLQIKAGGGSLLGGGLWMPEAESLTRLRRDVDKRPHRIKEVLTNTRIRKDFLGGVSNDAAKAVKAFAKENAGNALKTKPKGYDGDHKDIELLRLKNYIIHRKLEDDELLGPKAIDRICDLIESMVPFVTYLNSVVMPDEPVDSSDDDDDDDDDDNDNDNYSSS